MMIRLLFLLLLLFLSRQGRAADPYKVLEVDKNASQRDIQKAFHKLSLKYHPDKNKSKSAQEKFAEINNAYEILSDEEKRKNYDLYGDQKGKPEFAGANFGNGGQTYYSTGGPGSSHFTFDPSGWQSMGSEGDERRFTSFFGAGGNPFGFGFGDMFSNIFSGGMKFGNQHDGFSRFSGPDSRFSASSSIQDVNARFFNKQIRGQGFTWLLLFYTSFSKGYDVLESIMEDVTNSISGAIKAGKIDCNKQPLCKDLGVSLSKTASLFLYSYGHAGKGSLIEYSGDYDPRNLKSFCLDHLPRFSRRIELDQFDFPSGSSENLPQVLLLSTKKDTPVMWRVISGLYQKRFLFYDAEVHDVSHPMLRRLGVKNLPAIISRLSNGEMHVVKSGISVKDLKSGIDDLRSLLESLEKKNKKATSYQSKKSSEYEQKGGVSLLSASNKDILCGDKIPLCIIGVFKSPKAKENLETILYEVSRKTLLRRQSQAWAPKSSISYSLLDGNKQSSFFNAINKSGYRSLDKFLVAYKPRKGKLAAFTDEITLEAVEKFVSSVLSGDIQFSKSDKNLLSRIR